MWVRVVVSLVNISRRRMLVCTTGTLLPGLLAGCTSSVNEGGQESSSTTTHDPGSTTEERSRVECDRPPAPDAGPPDPGFPTLDASADRVPEEEDAGLQVDVTRQFTSTAPAEIRITFQNLDDEELVHAFGAVPPFSTPRGEHEEADASLMLVPETRTYTGVIDRDRDSEFVVVPETPTDRCWQAPDELIVNDIPIERELGPCETVEERYRVLAAPDSDACLAPGTYRFQNDYYFGEGSGWGFDLVVSSDGQG